MKRTLLASSLALVISAARLFAAAPVYSNNFVAVTLDGVRLGTDTDPVELLDVPVGRLRLAERPLPHVGRRDERAVDRGPAPRDVLGRRPLHLGRQPLVRRRQPLPDLRRAGRAAVRVPARGEGRHGLEARDLDRERRARPVRRLQLQRERQRHRRRSVDARRRRTRAPSIRPTARAPSARRPARSDSSTASSTSPTIVRAASRSGRTTTRRRRASRRPPTCRRT